MHHNSGWHWGNSAVFWLLLAGKFVNQPQQEVSRLLKVIWYKNHSGLSNSDGRQFFSTSAVLWTNVKFSNTFLSDLGQVLLLFHEFLMWFCWMVKCYLAYRSMLWTSSGLSTGTLVWGKTSSPLSQMGCRLLFWASPLLFGLWVSTSTFSVSEFRQVTRTHHDPSYSPQGLSGRCFYYLVTPFISMKVN